MDPVAVFEAKFPHVLEQIFDYVCSEAASDEKKPYCSPVNFVPEPFARFQVSKAWNNHFQERTRAGREPLKTLQNQFKACLKKQRHSLQAALDAETPDSHGQLDMDKYRYRISCLLTSPEKCHFCDSVRSKIGMQPLEPGLVEQLEASDCVGGDPSAEGRTQFTGSMLHWHAVRLAKDYSLCAVPACRLKKEARRRNRHHGGFQQVPPEA